jgi:hypothetical protein
VQDGLKLLSQFQTGFSLEDEMTVLDLIEKHPEFDPAIAEAARAEVARRSDGVATETQGAPERVSAYALVLMRDQSGDEDFWLALPMTRELGMVVDRIDAIRSLGLRSAVQDLECNAWILSRPAMDRLGALGYEAFWTCEEATGQQTPPCWVLPDSALDTIGCCPGDPAGLAKAGRGAFVSVELARHGMTFLVRNVAAGALQLKSKWQTRADDIPKLLEVMEQHAPALPVASPQVECSLTAEADRLLHLETRFTANADQLLRHVAKLSSLQRRDLAERPNLPTVLVKELASDQASWVRIRIASRPQLPESLMGRLAADVHVPVRCVIAGRPDLPLQHAKLLALDSDETVRLALARNPNLSPALVGARATDPSVEVRRSIATHPRLREAWMEQMTFDRDSSVRLALAGRQDLPETVVDRLAGDVEDAVRDAVGRHTDAFPAPGM